MQQRPIRQWIWRAFVQSALIPLILVESVLIAAYLFSNAAVRDAQIEHLQHSALSDLATAIGREAAVIDARLSAVEAQALLLRDGVRHALDNPHYQPTREERARHAVSDAGVFHTRHDNGGAASFYANSTPLPRQDHAKALRLAQIDPLLASIKAANAQVAAGYFNSWDSYNRIYPYFDVLAQYPHDMRIPEYNFYYLADAHHNPQRQAVWTDAYLDPAGQGWMMSVVAPVYRGDFLEGVAGLDITVGQMLGEIARLQVPWQGYALLIGSSHEILALPDAGERDFALRELTEYSYAEAVRREILKPEQFRLTRYRELQPLLQQMGTAQQPGNTRGVQQVTLNGESKLVAWAEVSKTGWHLLMVVDETSIFSTTQQLASHYQQLGFVMIAGLVLFYLLFFLYMWLRARQLSRKLAAPLEQVASQLQALGGGALQQPPAPGSIREINHMLSSLSEAAQQLQASESQRQEAQRHLQLVLDSTTESVWDLDLAQQRMCLSDNFRLRYGLASTCLALRDYDRHIHPDDLPRIDHLRRQFLRDGSSQFDAEYRFRNAQGQYVWLLSRGQVLQRDPQGQPLRVSGTHVNISRLKQIEDDLRQASERALQASQAQRRFLSSMSHELRTPLNAIQGFAQLIALEAEEHSARQTEAAYAREIVSASRHLTAVVDDILDLTSLESRRQQLQLRAVNVGELLSSCAELIQLDLQQYGQQLKLLPAPQPPLYVLADPRRLRQVLINLLSNAIKYNSPQGLVSLGYEVRQNAVRLWVEDHGPGLSAEQQAQLFIPFQRLGRENSNIPGTGIGLVLCRELASLMHGEIGLHSEPGCGSRFWIDLPGCAADSLQEPVGQTNKPLALCIEDHPASLRLLQEALRDMAEVESATTLASARLLLDSRQPRLLLLDLDLPDGNGMQLLEALQQDPRHARMAILVVTASINQALFDQAHRLGALACLGKPLDLQQLRRLAEEMLTETPQRA